MSTDHHVEMFDEISAMLLLPTVKVGDTITCQNPVYCTGPITFDVIIAASNEEKTILQKTIVPPTTLVSP